MRTRPTRRAVLVALALGASGCATAGRHPEDRAVTRASYETMRQAGPVPGASPMAVAPGPPSVLAGPQPVDAYIRRALAENRLVQAAKYNVLALRQRIPQVTALDDPIVSNTIYPSSTNGLQTANGWMPWNLLVAQQFPWFGTLRLRGEAAAADVQVAIAELAAAQLDAVAEVKRAYYDLYFNERAEAILRQNRNLVEDFLEAARFRYESNITQSMQEILRAEVVLADLDRELLGVAQGLAEARAALAQQIHVSPESDLRTLPTMPVAEAPAEVERLYQLASVARPELRGRQAAVVRDRKAIALARKRYYPNITAGVNFMYISKAHATSRMANGFDGIGMFVGFNLPVYHKKLAAAVCEAEARASADAKLLEAERDGAFREVKENLARARSQQETIGLFRDRILPRSRDALEIARNDYRAGTIDYVTLITAWREVLQIELQVAQFEAELGKTLATLERAVGVQLNRHPPTTPPPTDPMPPPPPDESPAPFVPPETSEVKGRGVKPEPSAATDHIDPIPETPPPPQGLGGRRKGEPNPSEAEAGAGNGERRISGLPTPSGA